MTRRPGDPPEWLWAATVLVFIAAVLFLLIGMLKIMSDISGKMGSPRPTVTEATPGGPGGFSGRPEKPL